MEIPAEIGIPGCCNPMLYPLGMDAHASHILAYGTLRNALSFLTEFVGNLGSSVILV